MKIHDTLETFFQSEKFKGKGPLCVSLVVTENAKSLDFPIDPEKFLAPSGGQVQGLGKAAVQTILSRHGIKKTLASEGGRTSRGSINNMRLYVALLNQLHKDNSLDFEIIEKFWIEKVRAFFAGKPFRLKLDKSLSLTAVITNLLLQAKDRQKSATGTMYEGTMMQHLVGAKLELLYGVEAIKHNSSNTKDQDQHRNGDFDVGDTSIHVTTSPSEALIAKCRQNLYDGLKPLIISGKKGVALANGLSENLGISSRIDAVEFEQFLAMNIYEHGQFISRNHTSKFHQLIKIYNRIIDVYETDPSMKIEVS